MNHYKRLKPLLGTFVEIGTIIQDQNTEYAIGTAFKAIEKIHHLLSFHDPNSELSRLNRSNGNLIELDPLSYRVLRLAKIIGKYSNELFNCTVGGVLVNKDILPKHADVDFCEYGNSNDIELYENKIRLGRPVLITLDGIAKGYAVDYAILVLKKQGVTSGWINAGGDLRIFGDIALPVQRRELNGSLSDIGHLKNIALSTSSITTSNKTYPGYIVKSDSGKCHQGSWSVMARYCWLADALTKVAGLADNEHRHNIIEKLGGKLVQPVPVEHAT